MIDCVCVADDHFQLSRPGDFDVTVAVPRTVCVPLFPYQLEGFTGLG